MKKEKQNRLLKALKINFNIILSQLLSEWYVLLQAMVMHPLLPEQGGQKQTQSGTGPHWHAEFEAHQSYTMRLCSKGKKN